MKKIVVTFGIISGVLLSILTAILVPLCMNSAARFSYGQIVGYSAMVLSFSLAFFGIRSYRDNVAGGAITFGKAFQVGILISLITCIFYVVSWEIVYFNFMPDFVDQYTAHYLSNMRQDGASDAEIVKATKEMAHFKELYANPLYNVGMTFLEVFPVGLIVTLVSAAILRRRRGAGMVPGTA